RRRWTRATSPILLPLDGPLGDERLAPSEGPAKVPLLDCDLQDAHRRFARHPEFVGEVLDTDRLSALREGRGMRQGEIARSKSPRKGEEKQPGDEEQDRAQRCRRDSEDLLEG